MNYLDLPIHAITVTSVWFTYSRFHRDPFSIFKFTALCYSIVLLGGVSIVLLGDMLFAYKMPIEGLRGIFLDGIFGLLLMYGTHAGLAFMVPKRKSVGFALNASNRWSLAALAIISVGSILVFAAANGISLGQTDYEYRYEAARGWGPLLIFIPAFLPFAFYRIHQSKGRVGFLGNSLVAIFVGVLTYFVMSGYRQVLIGAIVLCCCVAIDRKYIKKWHFLPGIGLFLLLLVSLSFLRYAGDSAGSSVFQSAGIAAFYYIQGDVFPVDAPLKIQEFYALHGSPPGLDVLFNHLLKLVPRAAWKGKPLILLDAAGFYTQEVVGYARGVTLSPTLLGEGYLIGGAFGFYLVVLVGTGILWAMDWARSTSKSAFYLVGSFIYGGFFFIREGLSELMLRAFFAAVFFCLFILVRSTLSRFAKPIITPLP